MDTELDMKDDMGWCCALLRGTTQRSHQIHLKVTARSNCKNMIFGFFIYSKPIWGAGDYYKWLLFTHFWSGTISPRIASMQFHPWGMITALVLPLSHPFSKAGMNQHKY